MIRSVYNHHSSNDSSNKGCILYMLVGFSYCMIYIFHTLLPAYLKYSCILITILPMLSVNYLGGNYSIILHLLTSSHCCLQFLTTIIGISAITLYGSKNGDDLRCRCLCYSVKAVVKSLLACMFLKEVRRILRQLQQKPVLIIHVLEGTLTNTFQPIIWIGLDLLWKI